MYNFFLNKRLKYILAGVYLNIFGYCLYIFFSNFLNFEPVNAALVSQAIIFIKTFLIYSLYVFKKKISINKFIKFSLNWAFVVISNIILLNNLIKIVDIRHEFIQLFIIIFLISVSYLLNRFFVFKN